MEYEEALSKATLQQIIRDLEASTSYSFYVKAYTSHGASKPSDSVTETTHGEGELEKEEHKHTAYLSLIINMLGGLQYRFELLSESGKNERFWASSHHLTVNLTKYE